MSLLFFQLFLFSYLNAQITLTPTGAGPDDSATIIFDAALGNKELMGATKVYIHHGVVTDKVDGTAWKYVKGNWGQDDGVGLMTKVAGEANKWQFTINPNIRAYFGVPPGENIFRISCVFRNAAGTVKGTLTPGQYGWGTVANNQDIYINLNSDNYINIKNPAGTEGFLDLGQPLNIQTEASADVTRMTLWLDEGSGFVEQNSVNSGRILNFDYQPTQSVNLKIKVTATINGADVEAIKSYNIVIKKATEIADLPLGLKQGVNYHENDPTKVTLVFLAPFKDFVYAVGDFSNWQIREENQMKRTLDGKYYWLELSGLTPNKSYVYQYWIDGKLKIADPYTEQVADPWNDKWIEPAVYPNLPSYTREDFGIASVFTTNQSKYIWAESEETWERPDVNHLVIYELHLRDFLATHSLQDLSDTISYLKRLGINAIELMPMNEFEGNDSWGYNPSFFFAADKYYGTKNDLKKFIEIAHQNGIAVILDIVLNHAFGQSPMVQMYFEGGKPAANNPWFNREYVGQYQWGYDFNHESQFTKDFIDDVNRYWIEEFHFDGYRFDFTKGFTNYAPGGSVDGFDQSRINILKRMADRLWEVDPKAYVILEHWSPTAEETQLGNYGMKMWRNKSYDFVPATVGNPTGSFANTDATSHVTFYNSHDERRIAEHCITEGRAAGSYNIKDTVIMYERVKMAAAFTYLQPGPKMIWQFDELGYDIDINFNGRVGRKPYVWGNGSLKYYNSTLRQNIYKTYQGILHIRKAIGPTVLLAAQKNHQNTGDTRRLVYNTSDIDLVVIGNFGLSTKSIDPKFTQIGKWYNYFSGDSINVANISAAITLKPGEWHIYTTKRLADGQPDVIGIYDNPVTITPNPFKGSDLIKVRFDAKKASPGSTDGLIGADKVYMHSGVILSSATNSTLTNVVGTLLDDGIGQMTKVGDDIWELSLTPNQYYNIAQGKEIFQIGMWFRNGDNTQKGYGFRNSVIHFDVQSDLPIVTITPSAFNADTEITITFDATKGNRELLGADKVYLHSGVSVSATASETTAWNKVVGNWGMDDGIGRMTKVPGESNKWQIKMTPRNYYNLAANDFPYWLAAVFRSANGNIKGTGTPGPFENGYIATNQDFFLKNAGTVSLEDLNIPDFVLYPNPSSGNINFEGIQGRYIFTIYNTNGQHVTSHILTGSTALSLDHIQTGLYIYTIQQDDKIKTGKLVID
jgi:1,4-alpha-glucan branching enzyme